MAPRRQLLPLLSAIVLVVIALGFAPRLVTAATVTFYVDTTGDTTTAAGCTDNDSGNANCSLRQAIVAASNPALAGDTKLISFEFFTDGPLSSTGATFTVNSALGRLPDLSGDDITVSAEIIDRPKIVIDAGGLDNALRITGDRNKLIGLSIVGAADSGGPNRGTGVRITGNENRIEQCYLGLLADGSIPATNRRNNIGILIVGGSDNVIGALGGPLIANYIAGNKENGVIISDASNNTVQNNIIGLYWTSLSPFVLVNRPNDRYGVQILSVSGASEGNLIGGPTAAEANIIGGNGEAGVQFSGTGVADNTVQVNYIGVERTTDADLGNSGAGILIEDGASDNELGGTTTALVISGNTGAGILIRPNGANIPRGNRITGAVYVGTTRNGLGDLGNDGDGIRIDAGATDNVIQGSGSSIRIAGNGGAGVRVGGAASSGNRIQQALIGIVPSTGVLPNEGGGVLIEAARTTSVVSSTISGNSLFGVRVSAALTTTLQGNLVGTDLAGTGLAANGGSGIELLDARSTTVFTNTVSGHAQPGLLLQGATASSVLSNTLTANPGGGALLATVALSATTGTNLTGNTISGNSSYGLRLSGALTTTMLRNYVGLTPDRRDRLPNTGNGLELFDARNTVATDTYVAGNTGAGIVVSGTNTLSTTLNNTVAGLAYNGTGYIVSEANAGPAVLITGGAGQVTFSSGTLAGDATTPAGPAGIQVESSSAITLTNLRIGWVPSTNLVNSPPIAHPFGAGIVVTGPISNVQILTNTLRFNRGTAITVSGAAGRVKLLGNGLSGNGGAIDLVGTSLLTARPPAGDPGSLSNPNHDIDPPPVDVVAFADPLRLRVGDQGLIDGYVITSTNLTEAGLSPVSACVTCTIQVFRPGPDAETATPGQGYTLVSTLPPGVTDPALATSSFRVPEDSNGRFTRQLVGGAGSPGSQLLLVATDGFGNSSQYAVFPVSTGFSLTSLTPSQSAAPGDTVTYTLRLSNTGTLDVTDLRLQTAGTLGTWKIATSPVTNTVFTSPTPLEAGSSRLITVTLTLPKGPDANVKAGITDVTTVTVVKSASTLSGSVRLETTVLPRPVLVVTPTVSVGKARPTETVPHTHIIRNDGNVTVTLAITERTVDPVGSTGAWVTTSTPRSLTLGPGQEDRVRVDVTVPQGAQVADPAGNLVQAQTYVSATVPLSPTGGFGPLTVNFTDTTQVDLDPDAAITDGDQEQDGAAGQPVVFTHFVRNLSNSPTRFCFVWSTNLGSTVSFVSRTDGFAIDANGCFSLDTETVVGQNRFQQAQFDAVVLVNRRALPGDRDFVNISLRNETTGETIGSAKVVNRINVVIGELLPRIYMPLIRR